MELAEIHHQHRQKQGHHRIRNGVIFLTFLSIPTLFAILFFSGDAQRSSSFSSQNTLPPRPRTFQSYPQLESFGPVADRHWDELLLGPRGGTIRIQRNETFVETWGISMFHGLHCLRMLRDALAPTGATSASAHLGHHEAHARPSHLNHCITYLAQSLLCAADDTIEPPALVYDDAGDVTAFNVDGLGIRHDRCRDPTFLYTVADRTIETPLPQHWTGARRKGGNSRVTWDERVWQTGKTVSDLF